MAKEAIPGLNCANPDPVRLLMLWNLFEGVPNFHRDSYEQEALVTSTDVAAVPLPHTTKEPRSRFSWED